MNRRPEVEAAARWWTTTLTGPFRHRVGDPELDAQLAQPPASAGRGWSAEQREAFRLALEEELEAHVASCWYPGDPLRGSAVRAVLCDWGPDPVLIDAARAAGLELGSHDVPFKTVMWINPGEVAVRGGYGAARATVWPLPTPTDPAPQPDTETERP
ncbi:hypothetical protein [Saccharothrix xinjiangensis]|uniref:Anti-proliferative protein domain-containing protein n=1 Tax=Saccharothrix xinjiangensis TaxID=204798 RepID=A0ABV9XT99_9PSEU